MRSPTPISCSLLLNGILAGSMLLRFAPPGANRSSQSFAEPVPSPSISSPPTPIPSPVPFQWSSLESNEYPTYIANLRGIGCPEQTIRDLICAELDAIYDQKRATLQTKSGNSSSPEIAAIYQEKEALLRELLGPSDTANDMAIAPSTPSPHGQNTESTPIRAQLPSQDTASLPYVFQALPDRAVKLTDQQRAQLETLRQTFLEEIGGANQNPQDPLYLEKWEKACKAANQRIWTLFGQQVYSAYQKASFQSKSVPASL